MAVVTRYRRALEIVIFQEDSDKFEFTAIYETILVTSQRYAKHLIANLHIKNINYLHNINDN